MYEDCLYAKYPVPCKISRKKPYKKGGGWVIFFLQRYPPCLIPQSIYTSAAAVELQNQVIPAIAVKNLWWLQCILFLQSLQKIRQ